MDIETQPLSRTEEGATTAVGQATHSGGPMPCKPRVSSVPLRMSIRSTPAAPESLAPLDQELMRGGLAPSKVRKIRRYIDLNLEAQLDVAILAAQVSLSRCHFSRAFAQSFGDSPRRYVSRRRVELAKVLMATTSISLGQIALECGLTDQPHLNRNFLKFVGETPGAWRRAQRATTDLATTVR